MKPKILHGTCDRVVINRCRAQQLPARGSVGVEGTYTSVCARRFTIRLTFSYSILFGDAQ
jgi:hypothetical protein